MMEKREERTKFDLSERNLTYTHVNLTLTRALLMRDFAALEFLFCNALNELNIRLYYFNTNRTLILCNDISQTSP